LRPVILCLHSVVRDGADDPFQSEISVTAAFLETLILDLKRHDIPILDLGEAVTRVGQGDFRPFVCITFDDGYRDVYENGFPVFRRHGVPFTMFLTTGLVDQTVPMWWHVLEKGIAASDRLRWADGEAVTVTAAQKRAVFATWRDRFRAADPAGSVRLVQDLAARNAAIKLSEAYSSAVTWNMVRDMLSSGLVHFGCHTVSHPLLSTVSAERLEYEVLKARQDMAREIGTPPVFFAYPFGQPDEIGAEAPAVVAGAGFHAAVTTVSRTLRRETSQSLFHLPRVLLARKAQMAAVVRGYMTGLPATLRGGTSESAAALPR
jgi:peptidoglycan/xylan/chitin deacetylase (PgdA/CDA1 family)